MPPAETPILFHYGASIYSHRVLWYLWLRNIPYDECIQPPVMPRPNLSSIGVGYRKIPLLAIGKDVYCDSQLIISKLEALYPDSNIASLTPEQEGIQKLFENYTIYGGIFPNAVKLMPYWTDSGLLHDKAFLDDREKLAGRRMTKETMKKGRPEGLQHIRLAMDMLETTFLADGRDWILGTKEPSRADIDAIWPFEWLIMDPYMKGSLSEEHMSEKMYPRVYAWVRRFMDVVEERRKQCEQPQTLDGETMAKRTMNASSAHEDIGFIESDPLQVKAGEEVEVYPSDYGQVGKSAGKLIGLTVHGVVIRNDKGLRLHFPRWNFTVKKVISKGNVLEEDTESASKL
jgi:glutathione S-transferase